MFDLVQAWLDGRFSALRDAIRSTNRSIDMADKEYDNSNRVALWAREDKAKGVYVGGGDRSDFGGKKITQAVMVTRERRTDRGPIGDLFWVTEDGSHHCAIFKNDDKIGGSTEDHWVNVFKNDPSKKGPPISVLFKPKKQVPAMAAAHEPVADDEIPF